MQMARFSLPCLALVVTTRTKGTRPFTKTRAYPGRSMDVGSMFRKAMADREENSAGAEPEGATVAERVISVGGELDRGGEAAEGGVEAPGGD